MAGLFAGGNDGRIIICAVRVLQAVETEDDRQEQAPNSTLNTQSRQHISWSSTNNLYRYSVLARVFYQRGARNAQHTQLSCHPACHA
jgi:hypothetical protein